MADSGVTSELKKDFDNTSPSAAATPCCKNVKAKLDKARFVPSGGMERVGDLQVKEINPDGPLLERATRFTQWVKMPGTVTIKVQCVCMDDGRNLNSVEVEKKVVIKFPLSYKLKALKLPFLAPLQLLRDLKEIDKIINDAAGGDPQAADTLKQLAGDQIEKQIKEAQENADNMCKNANKCAGN